MSDPVIRRFAEACGAAGPLDLRVDLADGGVRAQGSVPMPFTLVGRDDACDVTLTDADVNPRHAWLQVVGGRVFAVDLGSRTGLTWPDGAAGSGWLDVGRPAGVGPFEVHLRSPASPRPSRFAPGYNPLGSDPAGVRAFPTVHLEFRNGRRAKDGWTVNRLMTLIGRVPECKIHLTADDIAAYHCGLVLTRDGLWVVDLSGRGVVVNGERMRVSPLPHGAELWVGRFLIGVQYPAGRPAPPGRSGVFTPPAVPERDRDHFSDSSVEPKAAAAGRGPGGSSGRLPPRPPPEDEVPLGFVSPSDSAAGLPSSHIMADAFRLLSGPVSHPILVGGSGPTPPNAPVPPPRPAPPPALDLFATPPPGFAPRGELPLPGLPTSDPAEAVGLLLRQLGDIHAQLFNQFQNSLVLMVQLFGCLRREQLPAMQRELARIQELNAELAQLQGEVARRATEAVAPPAPPAGPKSGVRLPAAPPNPLAEPAHPANDSTALHDWVMDRVNTLQQERQARWQSLVGMFAAKGA